MPEASLPAAKTKALPIIAFQETDFSPTNVSEPNGLMAPASVDSD
jgi:hypothetical protein